MVIVEGLIKVRSLAILTSRSLFSFRVDSASLYSASIIACSAITSSRAASEGPVLGSLPLSGFLKVVGDIRVNVASYTAEGVKLIYHGVHILDANIKSWTIQICWGWDGSL